MKPVEAARAVLRLCGRTLHVLLRVLGWLFLIAVLGAGGLAYYVSRAFSPEDARRLAVEQLTALLHREVAVDHLVLSPHGLKVLGLRVRRGRKGDDADLLACDSVLVTIKLRPLLQRRLEFETVVFQAPQISLTRDEQGDWGLADVFGSSGAARGGAVLPVALAAAETEVEDGVLRIDDRLRGRRFAFDGLKARVTGFEPDKPFPMSLSFRTADTFAGRTLTARVDAAGRVDLAGLRWSSATATADRLRVEVEGVPLSGRASVTGFASPSLDLTASAPPLGPEDWRHLLGQARPLSLPETKWTLKADFPAPGMVVLDKVSAETPAGAASATGVFDFAADTPTLSVEVTARDADLAKAGGWWPSLAAHSLSGRGTLRASVTGWPGRLQAHDADLTLRGFGGTWGTRRVDGVDADVSASEDFAKLKITVSKGEAVAVGNTFQDVVLALTLDKQSLSVDHLNFRWGGSKARLRARVEHPMAPKEVALSGSVDRIDWEAAARLVDDVRAAISTRTAAAPEDRPWLRTFKYSIPRGFPDTSGHVHVGEVVHPLFSFRDVELLWNLRGVTPAMDKIGGEARLSFGPGRVSDIASLQKANKFMSVVFLPYLFMEKMNKLSVFSAATAYPNSLDFARIDGEYGAAKGVATIRYFHVDSPQQIVYAEGMADFAHEKVDMDILTRLPAYSGTLPDWWQDTAGRVAIGFRVKGDINKPDLEPRFKKIGENEIEERLAQARSRAQKRFDALERLQTLP